VSGRARLARSGRPTAAPEHGGPLGPGVPVASQKRTPWEGVLMAMNFGGASVAGQRRSPLLPLLRSGQGGRCTTHWAREGGQGGRGKGSAGKGGGSKGAGRGRREREGR